MRKLNVVLRKLSISQCLAAFAAILIVCTIIEWGLGGRHVRWGGRPVPPVACMVLLQLGWVPYGCRLAGGVIPFNRRYTTSCP